MDKERRNAILIYCILQCVAEDCIERKFNAQPTIKLCIQTTKQVGVKFVSFRCSAVWKRHVGTVIDNPLYNNCSD